MAGTDIFSTSFWLPLMAGDLEEARAPACQPVRVADGKAKLFAGALNGPFEPGAIVGFERRGSRILVAETPHGVELPEAGWWDEGKHIDLALPDDARSLLPDGEPVLGLLMKVDDTVQLMPIRVEEHPTDVLGPRILDAKTAPIVAVSAILLEKGQI